MQVALKNCRKQACPLCGQDQEILVNGWVKFDNGQNQATVDRERGYSFCGCRDIFYTNWSNMRQTIYDANYTERYDNTISTQALSNYLKYAPIIAEHAKGKDFLEIGCINPVILDGFKKRDFNTNALDIIPHTFEGHGSLTGNFEDMTIDRKFDVIWASHIFEHFHKPIDAVKKCHDTLNEGGLLFVAMPDPWFIDFRNPYLWGHWHLEEHHILWNMMSFCKVLEEQGFEIIFSRRNYGGDFICVTDFHILARKK